MNKADLTRKVAEELGIPRLHAKRVIQAFLDNMVEALGKGDVVTLTGFGRFNATHSPERIRRNPRTGEKVNAAPTVTIRFKGSRVARDKILKDFEHRGIKDA